MPITELIFPAFKPADALAARSVARTALSVLDNTPGALFHRVGHLLRHNGEDVSAQQRSVVGVEWDHASSFHSFFPSSPEFQQFVAQVVPYLAEKPSPRLFKPGTGSERSEAAFTSGLTHIFVSKPAERREEVQGAWDALVASLKKEERGVKGWSGWGIEGDDGAWLGVVGWDSIEALDKTTKTESVVENLRKVRGLPGVEEFAVLF
ncbi:hypothetical protein K491DRAFT_784364 [Lophiostoma macrostomum CBS 122681]|uniref:ABM domain-containing protein n=1 Tax=Lophiostoma macrostomum CBS 122681 TaxID=1314788 RepID=A0A6A6SM11_9PLEO|nr:hypothetical protein K491DRAFT_784364 [Lophiostoma macrostomum CBS 122681]